MISDFNLLSDKVDELAGLAHGLRRENAVLRADLALADAEKAELAQRMALAHERIETLLAHLPDITAQPGTNAPEAEPEYLEVR